MSERLDVRVYERDWHRKREWYANEGYAEGANLFTTTEIGGLQSATIDDTIGKILDAVVNL